MRKLFKPVGYSNLCAAVAIGALMASGPAFAQEVEELTVVGRLASDGQARSLSQAVNYSDLDLTLAADQAVLKRRVDDTARSLCDRLGEGGSSDAIAPSCRDAAMRDSREQIRIAIAEAPARKAEMIARAEAEARARDQQALAAEAASTPASAVVPAPTYTVRTVTNGAVPDTPENRSRYGAPLSASGARTPPAGD